MGLSLLKNCLKYWVMPHVFYILDLRNFLLNFQWFP